MLSKSRLSLLRSLRQKKFRSELGLFVAEGEKLVGELLQSEFRIKSVYASEEWIRRNQHVIGSVDDVVPVSEEDLSRISSLVNAPPVLAVAMIPEFELETKSLLGNFTLLLDGIRDPGNLGTIIRIADWFGIHHIICSPDSAEVWNPKVVQASMGSLLRVRVTEMEPVDFFAALKSESDVHGISLPPVFGTFLEGQSIYKTNFSKSGIIVIGNEANGIRKETEKFITQKINIPTWHTESGSGPESLNAAVATAIVCSEIRRSSL